MTPEHARQLNRLIWRQRLRKWGPAVFAVAAVFGAYAWLATEKLAHVDRVMEVHEVAGDVVSAARLTGRNGGFLVHVRLAGGKEVDAYSQLGQPPYAGEAVALRAASHASGRITYDIVRLQGHQPQGSEPQGSQPQGRM